MFSDFTAEGCIQAMMRMLDEMGVLFQMKGDGDVNDDVVLALPEAKAELIIGDVYLTLRSLHPLTRNRVIYCGNDLARVIDLAAQEQSISQLYQRQSNQGLFAGAGANRH